MSRCVFCKFLIYLSPVWLSFLVFMYWSHIDYAAWNVIGGLPEVGSSSEVLTPVVHSGGKVAIRFKYNILRDDCSRDIQVWRSNGINALLYSFHGVTKGEGNGLRDKVFEFPAGRHLGEYLIKSSAIYHCNPAVSYRVNYPAARYRVVP